MAEGEEGQGSLTNGPPALFPMNLRQVHTSCLAVIAGLGLLGADPPPASGLTWDFEFQRYNAQRGETNAAFVFHFANATGSNVVVSALRSSCPCTIASVPASLPWRIAPGETGRMDVNIDLRDRWEPFHQFVTIESSAGTNRIRLEINTPELTPREKNRRTAFADRQAVFKGACATCHLAPAAGKSMAEHFTILCGTCHAAEDRAEMVPDLAALKERGGTAYWDKWVRRGKPGTFMPAFAKPFGGPLTERQIAGLVEYLTARFPAVDASGEGDERLKAR